MHRRALSPGVFHSVPAAAEPRIKRAGETGRWPLGVSLTIALLISLGLWTGLIAAAVTLLSL